MTDTERMRPQGVRTKIAALAKMDWFQLEWAECTAEQRLLKSEIKGILEGISQGQIQVGTERLADCMHRLGMSLDQHSLPEDKYNRCLTMVSVTLEHLARTGATITGQSISEARARSP